MKIEITKQHEKFKELRFVSKAVAKESSRYAISSVCVDGEYFVATDGRRMHILSWPDHGFENGLYEVVKNNHSEIVILKIEPEFKFPKWQDIVPDFEDYFQANSGAMIHRFTEIVLGMLAKKNIAVVKDYLIPFDIIDTKWDVFFDASDRPVHFISDNLQAVIMPFMAEYEKKEFKKK